MAFLLCFPHLQDERLLIHSQFSLLLFGSEELVTRYGYSISSFPVHTLDNCTLTVFRLTDPRVVAKQPRAPVLLQHGFLDSATTWVLNAPEQSLGFLLASAGFEVAHDHTSCLLTILNPLLSR